MDVREKLVEILCKVQDYGTKNTCEGWSVTVECKDNETIADHLITNGVTVQEWIPVSERLPGFGIERVLVMTNGDHIMGYPKMDTDRYLNGRWVRYGDNVTHWMLLPEPPEEK